MGGRGRERLVHCEKCGRAVRRDKAVYIDKPILQNPLERHQISEPSTYRSVLTREVAYCPGCGKHLRVYEKKIKQNIRNDERAARQREFGDRGGRFPPHRHFDHRPRDVQGDQAPSSQGNAAQSSEAAGNAGAEGAADASSTEAKEEESEIPSENRQSER